MTRARATRSLGELLADGWELVAARRARRAPARGQGRRRRSRAIARRRELADEALRGLLEGGLAGRTEREVAVELERGCAALGAERAELPLDRRRGRPRRAAARRSRATRRSRAECS